MKYFKLLLKGLPWSLGTYLTFFTIKYINTKTLEDPWWMYIVGFVIFVLIMGPLWVLLTKKLSKN
jgi:hypothetical protein